MKMELPVRAPGNGRVSAVHCQAGELVRPNVSLIDFE
jgi:biotin carboxyl carrier protein